jgi:hypothetical protein
METVTLTLSRDDWARVLCAIGAAAGTATRMADDCKAMNVDAGGFGTEAIALRRIADDILKQRAVAYLQRAG